MLEFSPSFLNPTEKMNSFPLPFTLHEVARQSHALIAVALFGNNPIYLLFFGRGGRRLRKRKRKGTFFPGAIYFFPFPLKNRNLYHMVLRKVFLLFLFSLQQ